MTQPDATQEVLDRRARELARATTRASDALVSLVTFSLGAETYALDASAVIGVFRLMHLAPLPGGPARVAGVTAWRGELLTILDLRRVLGLPGEGLDDRAWVIVTQMGAAAYGLLAGALRGAVSIPAQEIVASPDGLGPDRRFVRGITSAAILVLDAAALAGPAS